MADAAVDLAERSTQRRRTTGVATIAVYIDFDPGCDGQIRIAAD